jgi:hypothetical protein
MRSHRTKRIRQAGRSEYEYLRCVRAGRVERSRQDHDRGKYELTQLVPLNSLLSRRRNLRSTDRCATKMSNISEGVMPVRDILCVSVGYDTSP